MHPTLAGVLVGLLIPSRETHDESSPRAERYASEFQPFSALLALSILALFTIGVHFESMSPLLLTSPLVIAPIMALMVNKPLDIITTAWLSMYVDGFKMTRGLRVCDMIPTTVVYGTDFIVSFPITSLAYRNAELFAETRFGVLVASLVAAAISGMPLDRQSKRFEKTAVAAAADTEDNESIDGDGVGQPSCTTESTMLMEHPGTLADGTINVGINFHH